MLKSQFGLFSTLSFEVRYVESKLIEAELRLASVSGEGAEAMAEKLMKGVTCVR